VSYALAPLLAAVFFLIRAGRIFWTQPETKANAADMVADLIFASALTFVALIILALGV
jgi:hypothetical protein